MSAFSAPGKALLAGGYLVLFPKYKSYVVALSSRMHAVISKTSHHNSDLSRVTVRSPQFAEGEWSYEFDTSLPKITPKETSGKRNPFLEATVHTVLSYIQPTSNFIVEIVIFSDAGYHSQENTTVSVSDNKHKRFLYHQRKITDVAKTGLGSSAGLVTVVTAALLAFFRPELDVTQRTCKDLIHNLAQVAHCSAQGKIGSGFDVAAAVYGSIVYRRFPPLLIDELITSQAALSQEAYSRELQRVVNSQWEFTAEKCELPPQINLLMGDIAGGSETPKLVSKVLQWHKNEPEQSEKIFASINAGNMTLIDCLGKLTTMASKEPETYAEIMRCLSKGPLMAHPSLDLSVFLELSAAIQTIRANFREMTKYTGAEIEPAEQTTLLDNCSLLAGVVGGVVPGAGGYDAICLLVARRAIGMLIENTAEEPQFTNVEWLNLHQEDDGVTIESQEDYAGLV
ncbi:hypothetical protein BABINDRAFT_180058 [Babjeviella inositovora NRRL Y-12698]|uniref:Phosphomevalonate kinase n=1 Tax=Babjeviella inositovora NRRL Y-12698 TaxID=984486 RepID=A0A1E3QT18_9ASCO|nr:uncharacterized protein BABINDRAFT_180058 [Babjeviella inositovora NRRL Y-12698]ODQ80855.1 hypothetical protein BABINDRAFT_180058 [Babjeviella inositovora NRRL Y-12698]